MLSGGGMSPMYEGEKQLEEKPKGKRKRIDALPHEVYYIPVLETLVEMGGSGRKKEIKERVKEKKRHMFRPADFDYIKSGIPRWYDRIGWAMRDLKSKGIITRISRGIYQITEEGRKYLEESKKIS